MLGQFFFLAHKIWSCTVFFNLENSRESGRPSVFSEDSAHVGATGLALEPLAW